MAGYLALVLHTHLPFIRHPEYPDFLEEDWLYEAIFETYVPLIDIFDRLNKDNVKWRLTISLTPSLISMLADPLLQDRAVTHIDKLLSLTEKEIQRTFNQPEFKRIALMYKEKFLHVRYIFVDKYKKNLVSAFKEFQDRGNLEIITCTASHGFLPLMEICPLAVKAQVKIGVDIYRKYFGKSPMGIWLPECGFIPEHAKIIKESGILYTFAETHGVLFGSPRPRYGVYAPVITPSNLAVFGRDIESSKQVWSAKEGYPGNHYYREFYRDVGFDLDYNYIKPYIHEDGTRIYTGIKYYRITGNTDHKEIYMPKIALDKAAFHAENFVFNMEKQIESLTKLMDRKPIIVAPYDAELFGHWWYEGLEWLNFLLRKICFDHKNISLITPSEYLEIYPKNQVSMPTMSSWGWKGYNEVWLNGSNDWIYRHLHKAAERMVELANSYSDISGLTLRALNQAARELLLAQSSDWAFIMKTGTHVEYAVKRTKDHLLRFTKIYDDIKKNNIDERWLVDIEYKDNIFPDIDYSVYTAKAS